VHVVVDQVSFGAIGTIAHLNVLRLWIDYTMRIP
jgi:hypothetical protein